MRVFKPESIRNVALIAHSGSGKTSLADVALFDTKAATRIGRVDDGSSVMDYEPEELKRKMTLSLKIAPVEWKDTKINLLDTPGYIDLIGDVHSALRAADSAALIMSAEKGVEVGAEIAWNAASEYGLPRIIFVNKLDRENTSFDRALQSAQKIFGKQVAPLHAPIGSQAGFRGVVDVCSGIAYFFEKDTMTTGAVPDDMKDIVENYRVQLTEAAVENDDALMMKYLDGEAISADELRAAVCAGVRNNALIPVLAGSAAKNIGVQLLLDTIIEMTPSASDTIQAMKELNHTGSAAFIFKTFEDPQRGRISAIRVFKGTLKPDLHLWNPHTLTEERIGQLLLLRGKQQEALEALPEGDIASVVKLNKTHTGDTLCQDKDHTAELLGIKFPKPAYTAAIEPKSKSDLDRLSTALSRTCEEDPTVHVSRDQETAETQLMGLGESHIEITLERMQRKYGVEVTKHNPHIPYRETIKKPAQANGRFKKQSGGHGQFGDVVLEVAPLPPGSEETLIFENKIVGGVVPREYVPGVEKGVREFMQHGFLSGCQMIGLRVALIDGKYHPVDSSAQAFEVAANLAMKEAMAKAMPVILEPMMRITIYAPEAFVGDITSGLNTKRGRISGMDSAANGLQIINAIAPMSEMMHYATDLRSITQGRGSFTMEFDHYEEVPPLVQKEITEAHAATRAQAS